MFILMCLENWDATAIEPAKHNPVSANERLDVFRNFSNAARSKTGGDTIPTRKHHGSALAK